ncbi:MAG: hypothetical protein GEU83_14060 [Pseudonocardiaceae bacterium]|nr:hypothetical protein [Pseudonocardiaceae bacterium]
MAVRILRGDPDGSTAEGVSGPGTGVRPGVITLAVGALALAVAPLLPVVTAADAAPADAGFPSWPLLVVLAVLPAAVAVVLAYRGAGSVAAGVVIGVAALAPGRALLDVQLIADAGLAARPELLVPTSLAPLQAGPAVILLLAGHLLTAVAGVWVLLATRSPERADESDPADGSELELIPEGRTGSRQGAFVAVLGLGAAAAVGVLVAPFGSDNAYLLGRSALDAPGWTLAGGVLLAVLAPAAACLLVSSAERGRARGGLLGVALGLTAVAAPPVVAALVVAQLRPAWGPIATLLAAAGLIISVALLRARPGTEHPARELTLPALLRLHRLAAVAALLAGALTLAAAALPAIAASPSGSAPAVSAARLLIPAGVVVFGLGVAMLLLSAGAGLARPALAVSWVVVPLASGAVLETVLTAGVLADVGLGAGSWVAVVAIPVAAVAGLIAALGGAVERDDVDLTELAARGADRPVLLAGTLAAVLAVPAFGLPVATGPDYRAAAIAPGSGLAAWGLATAMVAVMFAALVAARCRPVRAAALFAGAGLVVMVRLAELPLVASRIGGAAAAAGTWSCLACLTLLAAATVVAVRPAATPDVSGTTARASGNRAP